MMKKMNLQNIKKVRIREEMERIIKTQIK